MNPNTPQFQPPQQMTAEDRAKIIKAQQDLEAKIYAQLSAPFPEDAYSVDSSRGFDLTSIKAQYIVERLNTVLGISGWTMNGKYEEVKDTEGKFTGVLYHGELHLRFGTIGHTVNSTGYSDAKKNKGDSYKGAKTDALSKGASLIGVGNDVFKGLVAPPVKETTTAPAFKRPNSTFKGKYGHARD